MMSCIFFNDIFFKELFCNFCTGLGHYYYCTTSGIKEIHKYDSSDLMYMHT